MAKITTLQLNKSKKSVTVFLDDSSFFAIDKVVAGDAGLRKGLDLPEEKVKELIEADVYQRCLEVALRFLAYRPRSEREIKYRLRQRGFGSTTIDRVVAKLREQNLINDAAFAQFWKDSRLSSNPKSRRLIKYELMKKGVTTEEADKATGDVDDHVNAYKAGLKKARLLSSLSYAEFCKRLSNYLRWRGFNYQVIVAVSERLWQEKHSGSE